jgi:hypothetical protein
MDDWLLPQDGSSSHRELVLWLIAYIYYFCNYFIIVFFNSAIVACAKIRMEGGDPTVSDGFQAAVSRLPSIVGWALIAASVGLILQSLEGGSKRFGRMVIRLLAMAWSAITFLVIPILVIEKKGPLTALNDSSNLLKKTWGEQLVGNFSFGLLFFLLGIPGFIVLFLTVQAGHSFASIFFSVLAVMYLALLWLVQSTLRAIFQTAVYVYVQKGKVPQGFDSEQLMNSMTRRPKDV